MAVTAVISAGQMKMSRVASIVWVIAGCAALLITGYDLSGCGSQMSTTSSTGMATLTTSVTDPAECSKAVGGNYEHVYVTIVDIKANANSSAGSTDAGWVDLLPGMQPTQVDLLGAAASSGCFLATLGDSLEVQAGNYQQLRLILGTNSSTTVSGSNQCNVAGGLNAVNCLETSDGNWHALKTPSAQQTGLKIPASQLAGGSLNVPAGQTVDLMIDFRTCESIIVAGNSGQYILQPVLNAGQVSTVSTSINGTVVDSGTGKPIAGANVLVSLEQPDANGVDRVVESTVASSADGTFVFCPVMPGTYDIVVNAYNPTTNLAYNVAVETGVQPGDTTGSIPLKTATFSTTTLNGFGSTQNASNAAVSTLLNFYPLEANPVSSSSTKYFTVPLLISPVNDLATLPQETTASPYVDPTTNDSTTCPSGTDCAAFSMTVPQSGISVYNYSTGGPTPAASTYSTALASYTIDAQAWMLSAPTTADCTVPEMQTAVPAITVGTTAGTTLTVDTTATAPAVLNFTGCQ